MTTLEIIEQRQKEAQKVKESGILDRIESKPEAKNDELAEIKDFSFNVAWNFKGENKRQAEQKMNNLVDNAGYAIDYSKMK